MKTAKWESSAGALAAFLASKPQAAWMADLYTFTMIGSINGGAPLLYATSDIDVSVPYSGGTVVYSSKQVYFDQLANKSYGHWKIGLDVDTWQVIAAPSPQAQIGGQGWLSAIRAGAMRGAVVTVDRAYFDSRGGNLPQGAMRITPLGVVNIFTGVVDEIDIGRSNGVISINGHLYLLNQNMPRNLFQAGCRWTLFSPGCGLIAANFAIAGTAAGMTGNVLTGTVGTPGGSGTFALGRIVMSSGQNEGFSRSIRSWSAGSPASFTLMSSFPYPVASGDTFAAYPGCDKQENTCIAFGNLGNFGGMPFIPVPETAL